MGPLSDYTCKRFKIPSSSNVKFQQILKRNRDSKTHNLPNIECLHDFHIFYISYDIKKTFEKCVQKYINLFKKSEIELVVGPTKKCCVFLRIHSNESMGNVNTSVWRIS